MKNKNIIKNKKGGEQPCYLYNGSVNSTQLYRTDCQIYAGLSYGVGAIGEGIGKGVTYGMQGISNQFQKGIYTGSPEEIKKYSKILGGQHVSPLQAGKLNHFNLTIPQQVGRPVINIFPGKTLIFMGKLHPSITGIMGGVSITEEYEKEVYLADDGFFYLNKNFWIGQPQRCLLSDGDGIRFNTPTFIPTNHDDRGYNFCIWYSFFGHAPEGAGKNMNKKIINKKTKKTSSTKNPTTKKTVLTKNPTTKKTSSTKKPITKKTVLTKKPTTKKTSSTKNPTTKKTSSTKKPTTKKTVLTKKPTTKKTVLTKKPTTKKN